MHLAASSGDKSLSMASKRGGSGRSGRQYGVVGGGGDRNSCRVVEIGGERRGAGSEKKLLRGGFSLLLFPPFSTATVERETTAPRAPGDKNMMTIMG